TIAMALACDPKLLVLDEPTTGLDVTTQAQILDLLRRLRAELGTAMLYVTHNLGVVAEICDRVGLMYAGDLLEEAPAAELFGRRRGALGSRGERRRAAAAAPGRGHALRRRRARRRLRLPARAAARAARPAAGRSRRQLRRPTRRDVRARRRVRQRQVDDRADDRRAPTPARRHAHLRRQGHRRRRRAPRRRAPARDPARLPEP